jgi:hypothetical protein
MVSTEITPYNPPYFKGGYLKRALTLRGRFKESPYFKGGYLKRALTLRGIFKESPYFKGDV